LYPILYEIFWWIVAFNLFALSILVIFFWNARINIKRQINNKRFLINILKTAKNSKSSAEAAELMNISLDEYVSFCQMKGIDTPEERKSKNDEIKKRKDEAERKIFEEEAAWRAEQEKMDEERRKSLEEDTRKRKDRLKKFGFR